MFNIQKKYTECGCYRFLNSQAQVIYIGTSKNIHRRLFSQHFKKNGYGHLPIQAYKDTCKIEIVKTKDYAQALAFEIWAIDKYKPRFNKKDKSKDLFTQTKFDNEDLYKNLDKSWRLYYTFREYDFNKIQTTKKQNRLSLAITVVFFITVIGYLWKGLL